jgi:hypothetical protein
MRVGWGAGYPIRAAWGRMLTTTTATNYNHNNNMPTNTQYNLHLSPQSPMHLSPVTHAPPCPVCLNFFFLLLREERGEKTEDTADWGHSRLGTRRTGYTTDIELCIGWEVVVVVVVVVVSTWRELC